MTNRPLYRWPDVCDRVYVTARWLSLIHKQKATNRAAIFRGVHWWGRGGSGAQEAGCLTAANLPQLFWLGSSKANESPACEAPGNWKRTSFPDVGRGTRSALFLALWGQTLQRSDCCALKASPQIGFNHLLRIKFLLQQSESCKSQLNNVPNPITTCYWSQTLVYFQ